MEINFASLSAQHDIVIVPLFKEDLPDRILKLKLKVELPAAVISDFTNKPGQTSLVYLPSGQRIALLGLGAKKQFTAETWRIAIHSAVALVRSLGIARAGLSLPAFAASSLNKYLELTGFALIFSNYRFDWYKRDRKGDKLTHFSILTAGSAALKQALMRGVILAEATNNARDLANHPGNIATPTHLATHAQQLARDYRLNVKILGPKEIAKEKLGLVLGVARGSDEPPRFIVLEYSPAGRAGNSKQSPIVLIGKGLTFDSGGISIKPAEKMEEMKFDMAGGATVLGILEAAARLKLPHRIIGIVPSTENLVSGRALKPGDVLIAHDQTSVEIINTDAEGRLILADALSYAQKYYQPKLMIDYATLTGAVIVSLGDQYTGSFANTSAYNAEFQRAAQTTGEKIWSLPLADQYRDQLKSQIAEIKNVGDRGAAGAITAALFLEHFVKNQVPWIHLDIAGTAWTTGPKPYAAAGATGWGVYFTIEFLRNLK